MTLRPTEARPLRVWPGVLIAILLLLVRFGLLVVDPEKIFYAVMGGMGCAFAIIVWWLFFSRARWFERVGAIVLMIAGLFATSRILHESLATAGMGVLFYILAIPVVSLALVAGAVAGRSLSGGSRRAVIAAFILLACGMWALVRTAGVYGTMGSELHWRWTKTPEERLLAESGNTVPSAPSTATEPAPPQPLPVTETPGKPSAPPSAAEGGKEPGARPSPRAEAETAAVWPGFRGPHRDGVVPGLRIKTDWTAAPPAVLWRRPIGPGWSSFAVRGNLLYTQEQRGANELVACYRLSTGEPVWAHRDTARFWESNAGAGPRATPAVSNGRVYTFGATGIVNALDANNGAVLWTRNAASDTGTKIPTWGFSSSPLVLNDMVMIAAAGRLAAYDLATGSVRWLGTDGGMSYSSPHLLTIGGVPQVLLLSNVGATSFAPADGKVLWKHSWPGSIILQPAVLADGGVLISSTADAGGLGVRRLAVSQAPGGWTAGEVWTSRGLKPYFNDFVVHNGYAFGFDGTILSCIDLKDGARKWKGGRYGNGQLVLLPDQDLLLVVSEEGELALVRATPDQFTEVARVPGIEGKTWNHPVLAGDILLVRNSQEMAAFRLSLER